MLFMQNSHKDDVFQWVMENYKYHHDIGDDVQSPVFHTVIDRYSFRLDIQWSGKKKGKIEVYLTLCKRKNHEGPVKPFNREYTLALR